MKGKLLLFIACLFPMVLPAQPAGAIPLANPSFEDEPAVGQAPRGWENCGFEEESPPDVQPNGQFGVTQAAAHGNTYLGMVVRDNDSWECAGQPLPHPLQADTCYRLTLWACRAETYNSFSRISGQPANYNTPAVIRLWGGYVDKNREGFELLAETEPVVHTEWRKYQLKFTSTAPYDYLYLEAYYDQGRPYPYNGNVLVDELSAVTPCYLVKAGEY